MQVVKAKDDWHKKIAANRGEKWKRNMLAGRREALLNPSNIRIVRLRKNVHQSVLAKKLGMSEGKFGAIERGKQMVKKDVAEMIASQLGTPLQKLFKFVEKKKYIAITQKTEV